MFMKPLCHNEFDSALRAAQLDGIQKLLEFQPNQNLKEGEGSSVRP